MGKEKFLADEELTVNPNGESSGIFVSIGGHKPEPKKEKKHKKHDGKRKVTADEILDLLEDASEDVVQRVKAAFETSGENPTAVVTVESGSRFDFDGEYKNDTVAVVEIIDEEAEQKKRLAQIRKTLKERYDDNVRAKAKAEEEFKEPNRKRVYVNALNAQSDFLYHVLLQTNDDEWLTKVFVEIKKIVTSSPSLFVANTDTYTAQLGYPKDMNEFVVRRYLTEYFYTKCKFVEEVLKHPGEAFEQKLAVFKHEAKQAPPALKPTPKPSPKPVERVAFKPSNSRTAYMSSPATQQKSFHDLTDYFGDGKFAAAVHGALRNCVR